VTAPIRAPGGAYEGAGRQAALAVRGFSSIVVVSDEISLAAHAAIGIALAESAHRLVMVADLGDDTPPLQALVRDDDSHGIYDVFEFGTSFVRIAREVEGANNFYVMPSGTESPQTEEIFSSPRWSGFASGFAAADELLVLVADSKAPALDKLVSQVDGVILVGLQRLDAAPEANILGRIPHPIIAAPPKIDITSRAAPRAAFPLGRFIVAAVILLAAGIGAGAFFGKRKSQQQKPFAAAPPVDSAAPDSTQPRPPAVVPANPADSATATLFSVEILASNTAEGANFELQRHGSVMPAATISLVPIGDTEASWYKVHAGAFTDSAQAEQLLATLRRRRVVPDSAGQVVRAPFALLIDSIAAQPGMTSRVRERIDSLAAKQVPAYSLRQSDGSAKLYVGAFSTPEQSSLAATALRVAGLTPVLAYRTGRIQ
jgi:hypothetical protein